MKKSLKRLALAGAVSAAVGIAGIPAAQADAIFFPYVVTSNTVTTILSVVTHNIGATQTPKITDLHYENWHKNTGPGFDPNDNELSCAEFDYRIPTTPEDLVTYDVANHFGAELNVLFNDPTDYGGADFGLMAAIAPTRGFTLIDDLLTAPDGELYGEAMVYEIANGAAWGYRAYNSIDTDFITPNFSNGQEVQGEVLLNDGASGERAAIVFQPLSEWTTTLLVTPVHTDNQRNGTTAVLIDLLANDGGLDIVAFDRDESPVSGSDPLNVVCVGRIDIEDLISNAIEPNLQNGGWTYVETLNNTVIKGLSTDGLVVNESDGAVVFKLEFNGRDGATVTTFNGEDIPGVVNTANWLRHTGAFTGLEAF